MESVNPEVRKWISDEVTVSPLMQMLHSMKNHVLKKTKDDNEGDVGSGGGETSMNIKHEVEEDPRPSSSIHNNEDNQEVPVMNPFNELCNKYVKEFGMDVKVLLNVAFGKTKEELEIDKMFDLAFGGDDEDFEPQAEELSDSSDSDESDLDEDFGAYYAQQKEMNAIITSNANPQPLQIEDSSTLNKRQDQKDEKDFGLFFDYCIVSAKKRSRKLLEGNKKHIVDIVRTVGLTEERYKTVANKMSPFHATSPREVIVDDQVIDPSELPLLAGPISTNAIKGMGSLSLYTSLSDDPGNFQWRMVNVVDQLTSQLQISKIEMRRDIIRGVKSGPKDLMKDDAIITATLFQSVDVSEQELADNKPSQEPKIALAVEILASQTLLDLAKMFKCQSDLICTKDVEQIEIIPNASDAYDKWKEHITENIYPHKLMFIHDTAYINKNRANNRYLRTLNAWISKLETKEFPKFKVKYLQTAKIKDLRLRFGHPYVYMHQGNCEHILVFTEARLPRAVEPKQFPRYEKIGKFSTKYCSVDNNSLARWAVVGSDRVPGDPMLLCTECVRGFLFDGEGKKRKNKSGKDCKIFPFFQLLHHL